MVSFRLNYDPRAIDTLSTQLGRLPDMVNEAMQSALKQTKPALMSELQDTPAKRQYPSQYPIEWTSEKQRRAYFATDGFGAGIPYSRTGKMQNSWRVFVAQAPDGGKLVIFNTDPKARYVVGTLAKDDKIAYGDIQRFHRITGWQPAKPTVEFWAEAFLEVLNVELQRRFVGFVTRG